MANRYIILDVASAPIANAAEFIDKSAIEAPDHYVKPEAIANFIEKEYQKRVEKAGLDLDLARITAIGMDETVTLCHDEAEEMAALAELARQVDYNNTSSRLVTYGGFHFDLPLVMRRARYLGVRFPVLNIDRYKSQNRDLLLELSDRDPQRRRSLSFYMRRLGHTDLVKPLSGGDEAQVHATGLWDDLQASVAHDLEATRRLLAWWSPTL